MMYNKITQNQIVRRKFQAERGVPILDWQGYRIAKRKIL